MDRASQDQGDVGIVNYIENIGIFQHTLIAFRANIYLISLINIK